LSHFRWIYPTKAEPPPVEDPTSPEEEVLLDRYYRRMDEPVFDHINRTRRRNGRIRRISGGRGRSRRPEWIVPGEGRIDPVPIPDIPTEGELYEPWERKFSQPFFLKHQIRHSMGDPPLGEVDVEETVFVDKYESDPVRLPHWDPVTHPRFMPFEVGDPPSGPENVTLDKYYTPFSQNFHRLPPAPVPPMETFVNPFTDEVITLDKWYAMGVALETWPFRARRAVTGPEGQSIAQTVNTAPWIEMHRMDPNPIPDIPGVTYNYWFATPEQPYHLKRGALVGAAGKIRPRHFYLVLYYPHQDFPITDAEVPPCERPRRRPSRSTGTC
jgi:hypothetical protein